MESTYLCRASRRPKAARRPHVVEEQPAEVRTEAAARWSLVMCRRAILWVAMLTVSQRPPWHGRVALWRYVPQSVEYDCLRIPGRKQGWPPLEIPRDPHAEWKHSFPPNSGSVLVSEGNHPPGDPGPQGFNATIW